MIVCSIVYFAAMDTELPGSPSDDESPLPADDDFDILSADDEMEDVQFLKRTWRSPEERYAFLQHRAFVEGIRILELSTRDLVFDDLNGDPDAPNEG